VFVNGNDTGDHSETPLLKVKYYSPPPMAEFNVLTILQLGDFGLAQDVLEAAFLKVKDRYADLGTPNYQAPEQFDPYPEAGRQLTAKLNVWQAGKTICVLVLRGRMVGQVVEGRFSAEVGLNDRLIEAYRIDVLDAPYSAFLRKTLLRCLAYDLRERPSPRSLAKTINHALSLLGPESQDPNDDRADGNIHPEPYDDPGNSRGDHKNHVLRLNNVGRKGGGNNADDAADGLGGGALGGLFRRLRLHRR
jgi:serine/threonine protein kinase